MRLATALGGMILMLLPLQLVAQQLDPGAMCLAGTGRFATDYTVCTAALASNKYSDLERSALYRHRAQALRYMNNCKPALPDIDESLNLVEWSVAAWAERSKINQCLNQMDTALKDANRGLEFNEFDFQSWKQRGIAQYYLRQFDQANESLSRSIEANSYNAESFAFRALAAFAAESFEDAAWDFDQVSEQNYAWDMTLPWYVLSIVQADRDPQRALARAADKADGEWPAALIQWLDAKFAYTRSQKPGNLGALTKQFIDSLSDSRRVISALYFVGVMESRAGEDDSARSRFEKILEQSGDIPGQPVVERVLAQQALEKLKP